MKEDRTTRKQKEALNVIELLLGVARGSVNDTQEALELGDMKRAALKDIRRQQKLTALHSQKVPLKRNLWLRLVIFYRRGLRSRNKAAVKPRMRVSGVRASLPCFSLQKNI